MQSTFAANQFFGNASSNALFLNLDRIDAAQYPTVDAYVTVLDENNTPVKGLTESNFSVFENDLLQSPITVESLSGDSGGVSITLVIDVSGSMFDELDDAKNAAISFVRLMNEFDQASVIIFDRTARVIQDFTRDKNVVINAINNIQLGSGTAIYDAALEAINLTNTVEGKKAIIFLSDGRDGNSDADLEDVLAVTPGLGYPIYTIGLGLRGGKGTDELRSIAESSGGEFYETPTSSELEEIYRSLAFLLIRQSYKITYTANPCVLDGGTQQLRIEVQNQGMIGVATGSFQAPGYETALELSANPQPAPGGEFRLSLAVSPAGPDLPEAASLELEISFNPQFLDVAQPSAAHVLAGAMWGGAATHNLQFAVDENAGTVSISLQKNNGGAVSGKGDLLHIDFLTALETPDLQNLIFSVQNVRALSSSGCELPLRIEPLTTQSTGLIVWPGDTNTNGVVELTDVLPLGVYWEISGPPRLGPEDQLAWAPHVATAFTPKAATFADADGNGLVTERDLIPIALNWGKRVGSQISSEASQKKRVDLVLPQSRLIASISDGDVLNQQILTIWLTDSESRRKASSGIMLRLMHPEHVRIIRIEPGMIWPKTPLRHVSAIEVENKIAAGFMLTAGEALESTNGELLRFVFESDTAIKLSEIGFSEVALVSPSGDVQETDVHFARNEFSENKTGFQMFPAYPNPFNPVTRIQYFLASTSDLSIKIYDVRGGLVAESVRRALAPGYHLYSWDGKDLQGNSVSSGNYFVRLNGVSDNGERFGASQKILLLK